jgi:SAM-dependent methyltransferase
MQTISSTYHQSLHLGENQLEPSSSKCPFCGSKNRKPLFKLQEKPNVHLLKCTNCSAASASRMPTIDALEEYYRNYYKTPHFKDSEINITFDSPEHLGNHLTTMFLQGRIDERISILDFGGGDGSISYRVAIQILHQGTKKVDITVIDQNEKIISSGSKSIRMKHKKSHDDWSIQYNFVIASAIIEHLPHPKPILDGLLNSLKKGGIFYARTPYVVPVIKLLDQFGVKWDFAFPAHIHDLGQEFWETFFNDRLASTDFQILASKPSLVETSFKNHTLRTVAAYLLKAPWYLLGNSYKLVGGWEIFSQKL